MSAAGEVLDAAVEVARAAPADRHQFTFATLIPWSRIDRLRDALDAADIEWRDKDTS